MKGYKFCVSEQERIERKKAASRKYYRTHKQSIHEGQQRMRKADPRRSLIRSARKRAKRFNIPINITVDDIFIPEICPILGIKLEKGVKKVQNQSPSLDKIQPELGYIKGNVKVISYAANRLKSNMNKEVIQRLYDYVFNA